MNGLAAVLPPISDLEKDVVNAAKAFARDVVEPNAGAWEAAGGVPREAFREAAARGLCRLTVPETMGGHALGVPAVAMVVEALAAVCMASAFALTVHNNVARAIARYGNAAQQERWLPGLSAGERIGAFLLTEPQGGSDAAAIRTTARRDGNDWRLDGAKGWVSNGATADLLTVYAQTDTSAGWRGIACFVVDAGAEGVIREPVYRLLGGHALGTGGFRFEGCRIGCDGLLVPPGEGFKAALAGVDFARITVAAMCCGMMGKSLEIALGHGAGRRAFGKSVLEHQAVQMLLADTATDLEAARLLTASAATALEKATGDHALAAAHAKKFATRAALTRIADCMQAMGANGFRADYPLARHLTSAKMAHYLDGTTEIQNVVIGRAITRPYLALSDRPDT